MMYCVYYIEWFILVFFLLWYPFHIFMKDFNNKKIIELFESLTIAGIFITLMYYRRNKIQIMIFIFIKM